MLWAFGVMAVALTLLIAYLGGQSMALAWYTAAILAFLLALLLYFDGRRYIGRLRLMRTVRAHLGALPEALPAPQDALEGAYQAVVRALAGSVVSDAKWLGFILEQLLSNAVKYTNEGGVKVCMESGCLVIEDSGIGIRPEDLPRIFEKGYTGYNGRVDTRASGVGLYLTRQVADALAIRIDVRSQLGHGTRVALSFPDADTFRFRE